MAQKVEKFASNDPGGGISYRDVTRDRQLSGIRALTYPGIY